MHIYTHKVQYYETDKRKIRIDNSINFVNNLGDSIKNIELQIDNAKANYNELTGKLKILKSKVGRNITHNHIKMNRVQKILMTAFATGILLTLGVALAGDNCEAAIYRT